MTSSDAKLEKIQTHFKALSAVALSLNTASDELTKAVTILDEALKKLNVGLTVWVTFRSRAVEEWEFDDDQIGYAKVQGKWGVALRHLWGDHQLDTYDDEGPWLFNDAPRELRLGGVEKIPDVIETLAKAAFDTTKKIQEKTKDVRALAGAITSVTAEAKAKPLTLAESIAAGQKSVDSLMAKIASFGGLPDRDTKAGGK